MLSSTKRVKLNRAALKDTTTNVKKASKSLSDIDPEESPTPRLFAGKHRNGAVKRGRPRKKTPDSVTRGQTDDRSARPQREANKGGTRSVKQRADVAVNPNRFAESNGHSGQVDKYPTVTLCDVAKCCNPCSHKCGYMLPDCLETKVVQCFQQNMRASFHFLPGCSRQRKSEKIQRTLVENGSEVPDSNTFHLHKNSSKEDPSSGCSHFLPVNDGERNKSTCASLDTHAEGDCVSKLDVSCPKSPSVGHKGTVSTSVQEHSITKKPTDGRDYSTELCGAEMSFLHDNSDTEDPETFTCQRVREYVWKIKDSSCARTDMIWPFERRGPTSNPQETASDSLRGLDDALVKANETNTYSPNNKNNYLHPNAPKRTQEEEDDDDDSGHCIDMIRESDETEVASKEVGDSFNLDDISTASVHDRVSDPDGILPSTFPVNGPKTTNPSPPTLDLRYWESSATSSQSSSSCHSPMPSPVLLLSSRLRGVSGLGLEAALNTCQENQVLRCSSLSSAPRNASESPVSFNSLILNSENSLNSDEEQFVDRSPPKSETNYSPNPYIDSNEMCSTKRSSVFCRTSPEHYFLDCRIPPLLSPVRSPKRIFIRRSIACQSSGSSNEESHEELKTSPNRLLLSCPGPQMVTDGDKTSQSHDTELNMEVPEGVLTAFKSPSAVLQSPTSCKEDSDTGSKRQREEETTNDEDASRSMEADSDPVNIETNIPSDDLTDCSSSKSNDEEKAFSDGESQHSATDEISDSETVKSTGYGSQAQVAESPRPGNFDEITAYEHDVLLLSVTEDDPELFNNLPKQSLLNLGTIRASHGPKPSAEVDSRCASFNANDHLNCPEITEMDDDVDRPWRPQSHDIAIKTKHNKCPTSVNPNNNMMYSDYNNNDFLGDIERSQHFQSMSSTYNPPPPMSLESSSAGPWTKKSAKKVNWRLQKMNSYCRHYFSETHTCQLKMCRFLHLPMNGDEKFCVETVVRFLKNPMCLHKAQAVYTGYYKNNAPGAHFCMPWSVALLWALLKAGMITEVFLVLNINLDHKIVPSHDFLLILFCHVREKGLVSFGLELLQLTFKMVNADLDLSLDCLDCMKTIPTFKQIFPSDSLVSTLSLAGNHKLMSNAAFQENLSLANSLVEMEFSIKQEDWRHMGEVFGSIRWFNHHPSQMEHISGRIAIALLSDSKDKQAVPFTAFIEAACQKESEDSRIRIFAGRIGVSLFLRYHKTSQWAKGRKVLELLSFFKINYSTMKSLFGNEDVVSRCSLITVATEFFLQSGSVEAALNTLRENNWFLSSCLWPCEPVDLENRINVLMNLLEKTSHRDSLEVLSNLPGIKESNDFVDTTRYCSMFNAHLQMCVERQTLPVAADTVAFMLCKKLHVKYTLLQVLLHKLGKQNIWLRARNIFRDSLRAGYYSTVSAPPGLSTLNVPCLLCEVELALSFEMFITVNASTIMNPSETPTALLSITLKRTQSDESRYLSSGSHLLAAAGILQPKIIIHYTAVNSSQEQMFLVELASAQRWLSYNRSWATELWTR